MSLSVFNGAVHLLRSSFLSIVYATIGYKRNGENSLPPWGKALSSTNLGKIFITDLLKKDLGLKSFAKLFQKRKIKLFQKL